MSRSNAYFVHYCVLRVMKRTATYTYNNDCEMNVCVSDYLKASFFRDRPHHDEGQDDPSTGPSSKSSRRPSEMGVWGLVTCRATLCVYGGGGRE